MPYDCWELPGDGLVLSGDGWDLPYDCLDLLDDGLELPGDGWELLNNICALTYHCWDLPSLES